MGACGEIRLAYSAFGESRFGSRLDVSGGGCDYRCYGIYTNLMVGAVFDLTA